MNSVCLLHMRKGQNVNKKKKDLQKAFFFIFREIERDFPLRFRAIGPSEFFGARRKVVLRGEDNAWTPVLRSFDKLREVGVLFYLKLHFI